MEDQPADPGDLTAPDAQQPRTPVGKAKRAGKASAAESPKVAEPESDDKPDARAGQAESESGTDTETPPGPAESETDANGESDAAEHRPVGKRLVIAVACLSALFVAAGAFAGAAVQPYLADRALVATKLEIARTAANAINTLWTYTPEDMEGLRDRSRQYLAGDFAEEYRRFIDAIAATNKQAQVSNNTQVMGAAVESVNGSEATALVYTNSVATSPVSKNIPSLRYLSYRLTLERHGADWLITHMTAVTKLDLTPQL